MHQTYRARWSTRAMSLLLAMAILLGLAPAVPGQQAQAHWSDAYLNQLVEWGFIRSDQANAPTEELTRADFMSIVNRAYGYHVPGETPFTDVKENDWYYDDVGIAYTAKYIKGTSPTTVSPQDTLTRETAATILGRNMMLQESAGEILGFTDARDISSWARGTIKSSLEHYLVSGYDDGTFRPQKDLTWGEMASMLTSIVGTPLQEAGDYALGGVFGNVTITAPGVTLRDSIISGDLYITGGVGLGDVKLENVTVLGRIIASGTGESESGGASITLRNVVADELLVDNLQDNYVTLKADGITEIGRTTVRTSAYIEDNTPDGMGLKYISLEGDPPPAEGEEGAEDYVPVQLDLAGRIEEVVNRTPGSQVRAAKGTVAKLTVDEAATESTVIIDRGAEIKELNLDTGTAVSGEGDIKKLNVNAPGSTVTMLPEEIYIRPGITAVINGQVMDSTAAEESSREPMILSGYPTVTDIAPNSATATFATNKRGTIYWAVSAITDGSVGEDDLIKPPAYGSIAIQTGTVISPQGDTEVTAALTGLTADGSYYLSAVMVDDRGQRSPTKVVSFTTPDNTVPAFNTGYPYMSSTSPKDSVAVVSANKDCVLYYALMPQNAQAPTVNELKAAAVSGALGYGVRTLEKNIEDTFRINDRRLEEKTTYTVYFWLTDANGANSSAIVPLTFTTADETPPKFIVEPTPTPTSPTSVDLTFRLDEDGTVYWVAVPAGTPYPWPEPGTNQETAPLNSLYAILQVTTGMNKGTNGLSGTVRAVMNQDGTISVTGMLPEQAYDFYYIAKDDAGPDKNYSAGGVKKITIHPSDGTGPIVRQSFTKPTVGTTENPTSDTDIVLTFSEDVKYNGKGGSRSFLEMWDDLQSAASEAERKSARDKLTAVLQATITLYKIVASSSNPPPQEGYTTYHPDTTSFPSEYVLDYTQVTIERGQNGAVVLTFPNSGLHLENGGQYCFKIHDIIDTSTERNPLRGNGVVDFITNNTNPDGSNAEDHFVPPFTVEPAILRFLTDDETVGIARGDGPYKRDANGITRDLDNVDFNFHVTPESTSTVNPTLSFDLLFFTNTLCAFDLYYRVLDDNTGKADGAGNLYTADPKYALARYSSSKSGGDPVVNGISQPDPNGWVYLGNSGDVRPINSEDWRGRSLGKYFNGCDATSFPILKELDEDMRYQFVITMTKVGTLGGENDRPLWDDSVYFEVNAASGQANQLDALAGNSGQPNRADWNTFKDVDGSRDIGRWWNPKDKAEQKTLELEKAFKDERLPHFATNNPIFATVTDTEAEIQMALATPGWVFYAISPAVTSTANNASKVQATRKLSGKDGDYVIGPDTSTENVMRVPGNDDLVFIASDKNAPPPTDGSVPMPAWMKGGEGDIDDPALPNLIEYPTPENITDGTANGISRRGSVQTTDTLEPETVKISNLDPNTTYYLYCVIRGNSTEDQSHVYIYQFTTDKAAKPKLNLTMADSNDGNQDFDTLETACTVRYQLYTKETAGKIWILNQRLSAFVDTAIGGQSALPPAYQNYTILQALTNTYSISVATSQGTPPGIYLPQRTGDETFYEDGYSVFDIYANDDARQKVYQLITSRAATAPDGQPTDLTETSDAKAQGSVSTRGDSVPVTGPQSLADAIEEDNTYVVLAYAIAPRKQGDPPGDHQRAGFKGADPVQKPTGGAPNLDEALTLDISYAKDGTGYNGSVVLTFDKIVYTSNRVPVDSATFQKLLFKPDTAGVTVTAAGGGGDAVSSYRLSFTNLQAGQAITISARPPQLFNFSGTGATETLSIRLMKEDIDGRTQVYLRVEWGIEGQDPDYKVWDTPKFWEEDIPTDGAVNLEGLSLTSSDGNFHTNSGTSVTGVKYDYVITLDVNATASITAELTPATGTQNARVQWSAEGGDFLQITRSNNDRTATIKALNVPTTAQAAILVCKAQSGRTITKRVLVNISPTTKITGLKLGDQELKPAADGTYAAEMLYTANNNKGQELAVELSGASEEMLKNVKLTVDGGKSAKNGKPLMKVEPSGNVVTLTPDPTQIAYAVNEAKGDPVVATFTIGVAGSKDDKETLKITLKLKQGDKSDSGIFSQTPAKKK